MSACCQQPQTLKLIRSLRLCFFFSALVTTNICEQTEKQFNDLLVFGTPDYIAPEVILRKGYGKGM